MLRISARLFAMISLIVGTLLPLGASAQWSGTNGQIFFAYQVGNVDSIAAANPDKSESHIVIQGTDTKIEKNFAISPTGSKIAYVEDVSGGGTEVYSVMVANSDGSSPTLVYSAPSNSSAYDSIRSLTFSPDGLTIFFDQANSQTFGDNGIYSVLVSGGTATKLLADSSSTPWTSFETSGLVASAANSKLYFVKYTFTGSASAYEVDSMNFDGTNIATVYDAGSTFTTIADVLPDGSKLLLAKADAQFNSQLFTVDTATGLTVTPFTSLSPNGVAFLNGSFSLDGAKLIYLEVHNATTGTTNIGAQIVSADGSGTPVAFRLDAFTPTWSNTALATAGTYPTPLVLGDTSVGGGAGGTPAPSTSPGLPKAGAPVSRSLPIALLSLGLLTVGAIEVVGRVRRTNR